MHTLWVTDAFTNTPLKGNPAGVCIFDEFPSDEWMQDVANELGFSNSAFLKKLGHNHYHIRWFTPHSEAPLCGHASIAALHVLAEEGLVQKNSTIALESLSGQLSVSQSDNWYTLNFPLYPVLPKKLTAPIRAVLNHEPIFTGFAHNILFMEFTDEDVLYDLKPDLEALKNIDCRALAATARGRKYDFLSRYFAPKVGINEDPVCASAHCRLIPYWSEKLGKQEMLAYQASSRGGILKCKNLGNRVLISGEAVTVFKGKIADNQLSELKHVA